ncbi:mycofactocin-coupled SDR family oxidoreductase [Nocardioides sp. WS12]|uniref:mycofactocin-coupled SDR family oxidoreductase n=1 Tax=Nocardioides sp. WS12 TaxID=2486272 RepID=UPI0015FB1758|nr:mycofactocin-coupled SDR family oxidoreductase [Nocardioides sp. WS12]
MAGRVQGKVALITGAARGQGRSHAVRLAEEGADIIAIDICRPMDTLQYDLATPDDMAETVKLVEELGRRIVPLEIDVRDFAALKAGVDDAVAVLGRLDIVAVNHGVFSSARLEDLDEKAWHESIDVNLTGAWLTAKATVPHLRAAGGGAMVITSSVAGLRGAQNAGAYVAGKHGVVGLMRSLALELAADHIRVNTVHPAMVDTPILQNAAMYELWAPDLAPEDRTREALAERFALSHALPIPWLETSDLSNALLFLVSDEGRYVTGVSLPIDAGCLLK